MRFSTILSLLIALLLAGAAVIGTRTYLSSERQDLLASFQQQAAEQAAAAAKAAAEAAAKAEQEPKETIVVAAESIQFGELISASTVREIEWTASVRPEGSYRTIEDLVVGESEQEARYALTTVAVGEPILVSKVTEPGQRAKLSTALTPGMKAVSIRVNDVLGVAGFVLPGDRVDVFLTRGGVVDVLLQGVKVLAIDQIADQRKDNPSVVRTVTFEVDTQEAQKLVLGGTVGMLSLALRNVASTDIEKNQRITISDLNELDIAEDILKVNAEKNADEPDPTLTRIEGIEQMMRELSSGVSEKLEGVEAKLEQEPVIQEVVVEKIIEVAPAIPVRSTVGVIRNGKRNEYKVDTTEEDGGAEEASLDQEIEVQVSQ